MCGIIGILGTEGVADELVDGLKRLEYRGYDSAGVAFAANKKITQVKTVGRVADLESQLKKSDESNNGIAHTRWATRGPSSMRNSIV